MPEQELLYERDPASIQREPTESRYDLLYKRRERMPTDIINQSVGTNPDQAAQDRKRSQRYGIPFEQVQQERQVLETRERTDELVRKLFDTPVTRQFYQDPVKAKVAHDDVESLSALERMGRAFEKGQVMHQLGGAGTDLRAEKSKQALEAVQRLQHKLQGLEKDPNGGFVGYLGSALTVLGQQYESLASGQAVALVGGGGAAGAAIGLAGGPGAFATVPGGAIAGGVIGLFSHMALDSFEVEGGLAYIEMLDEGIDDDVATMLSSGVGVLNAGLEVGSATVVLAPISQAGKALLKGAIRNAVKDKRVLQVASTAVKQYGAAVFAEVTTEALQESVNIAATEWGKALSDADLESITMEEATERVVGVMIETAKAMSVLAAPGPGFNATVQLRQAQKAKKNAEVLDVMKQVTEESKLKERAPDVLAEHVANVMKEHDFKSVFIPARHLAQWATKIGDPKRLLKSLGVESKIEEQIVLDGDVEISNKNFAEFILQSDQFEGIKDHIRMTEEEMTPFEAEEYVKSGLKEDINRISEEQDTTGIISQVANDQIPPGGMDIDISTPEGIAQLSTLMKEGEKTSKRTSIQRTNEVQEELPEGWTATIDDKGDITLLDPNNNEVFLGFNIRSHRDIDFDLIDAIDKKLKEGMSMDEIVQSGLFEQFEEPVELEEQHLDPEDRGFVSSPINIHRTEENTVAPEVTIAAEEIGVRAFFRSADEAGMTPKKYQDYLVNLAKAREIAVQNKKDQVLKEEQRALTKEWQKELAQEKQIAADSLSNQPVYQVFNGIGNTRMNRESTQFILEQMGMNLELLPKQNKGRNLYTEGKREPGIEPSEVAELYGYESAYDMLADLVNSEHFNDAVDNMAQQRMREKHGSIHDRLTAILNARAALHNNDASKALEAELNAIRKSNGKKAVKPKVIRNAAKEKLKSYKLRDIKPNKFLAAEKRLARQAGIAWRKGDRPAAEQLKLQQILNFHMAKEAYAMEKKINKRKAFLKKYTNKNKKFPNISPTDLKAIRELLAHVRFTPKHTDEKLASLIEAAQSKVDPVRAEKELLDEQAKLDYQDMTLEDFTNVHNTVKEIVHRSTMVTKLRRQKEKRELDITVAVLNDLVNKNVNTRNLSKEQKQSFNAHRDRWNSAKRFGSQAKAMLFTADTILRQIDGWKDLGAAYENLKGRYDRAMSQGYHSGQKGYLRRSRKAAVDMSKLFDVFSTSEKKKFNDKIKIPGLERVTTHNEVIAILLNSGNAENIQAMLDSGITQQEIDAVHNYATKKDWDFAQSVWDYLDTYWDDVKTTEERRRNYTPERVDALPFTRKFGDEIHDYKGGYYPIRYDRQESIVSPVEGGAIEDMISQIRRGDWVTAHTRRGHTEMRKSNPGHRLNLDVFVFNSHVDQVIYDLEVGDALADFVKILHHKDVKKSFVDAGAVHLWEQLDLWFRDAVIQEVGINTALEKSLRYLRIGFTVSKLGWNVGTIALQPLGIIQTSVQVGKKNMMYGVLKTISYPWFGKNNIFDFVSEQSGFMEARMETFNKDILDAQKQLARTRVLDKITPGETADIIRNSMFWGIKKTQRWADTVTWIAGHEQGLDQGMDPKDAVRHADRMVARTQASGIFAERTPLERGTISTRGQQTELVRAWTPLISFFMAKTNVAFERTKKTNFKSLLQLFNWITDMFLLYSFEALLAGLIRGQWPDEDDDQTFISYAAGESVNQIMAGVPILREGVSAVSGFSTGGVPGTVAQDFGKAIKQMGQGEADLAAFKAVNNLGGILLHYPSSQINKTVSAIAKKREGEDINAIEFIMGPHFER